MKTGSVEELNTVSELKSTKPMNGRRINRVVFMQFYYNSDWSKML